MSTSVESPSRDALAKHPAAVPARRSVKRSLVVLLIIAVLLATTAWFIRWWSIGRFIESTDDAYLKADSVTVAPQVSGYVTRVFVEDNQSIKAGDPLVQLDVRQYQATLAQARATVVARDADIRRAQAAIEQQRANVLQAKAQLKLASIDAAHASEELERYAPLAVTGAETRERVATLKNARDRAQAVLSANSAGVSAAEAQITATEAQIALAQAQMEAARATQQRAQLDTENTLMHSALTGRVADRSVRVGQYVQPGTRLLTVVPAQQTYLEAYFKETQIGQMRIGQPASLHIDAFPDIELHGEVTSFAPGTGAEFALLPPENATGNFTKIVQRVPVRIHLDAGDEMRKLLLPGLSVRVDIDTRSGRDSNQRLKAENGHG